MGITSASAAPAPAAEAARSESAVSRSLAKPTSGQTATAITAAIPPPYPIDPISRPWMKASAPALFRHSP